MKPYFPPPDDPISEPIGAFSPDGRSYCANADLFTHNLLGQPRYLPDAVYTERANFFHHLFDQPNHISTSTIT